MVLILVGTVIFFAALADNLSRSLRENFTVEVLLNDSIDQQQAYQLQTLLKSQPYTRQVVYTSKEEATRQQVEASGLDNDFLGSSPIPASFEVHLKANYADTDSLQRYMPLLNKDARVSDVIYPGDLMKDVNRNIRKVSIILLIVAVLLGFVSLALINNTLRMSVAKRRDAIQTMKLVGAKWSLIRRPFLTQAFYIGLISSIVADLTLWGAMLGLRSWDEDVSMLVTPTVMVLTLIGVPAVGISLTVISAYFSVNRHIGMRRDDALFY
jgi:cell division protein ftsX